MDKSMSIVKAISDQIIIVPTSSDQVTDLMALWESSSPLVSPPALVVLCPPFLTTPLKTVFRMVESYSLSDYLLKTKALRLSLLLNQRVRYVD